MTILTADGLCFAHPQTPLFTGLTLRIGPGVTLVRGGDGRGKTTLLRLLAGELPAQGGDLCLAGVPWCQPPLAYQAQVCWLDPRSTAHDTISAERFFELQRARYPHFLPAHSPAWTDLTEGLALQPHAHKPMHMLSTGTKRKVWLASALAAGATLTLLDDPFAALDKPSITFVMAQLTALARHPERTVVVAHHDTLGPVPLAQVIDLGD